MTAATVLHTSDGRKLTLRSIGPGDMLDLIEAAGTAAGVRAWMSYAIMIVSVSEIDGKPVMLPHTKQGVRDLGNRVGNAGLAVLSAHFYPDDDGAAEAESTDTAKN